MNTPSFTQIRNDLVAHLYGFALAQEAVIRSGASDEFLGLKHEGWIESWPAYQDFDLENFQVAERLQELYRYAYHGEMHCMIDEDSETGNLGRLAVFLEITAEPHIQEYIGEIRNVHDGEGDARACGLPDMVRRAKARLTLDEEPCVGLADIALLAGMNERSVRNALHASGEAGLIASRAASGEIVADRGEALRWLRGRRGFIETVWAGAPSATGRAGSGALEPDEILPFIRRRLAEFLPEMTESVEGAGVPAGRDPHGINRDGVAMRANWDRARLDSILDGTLDSISPDDCPALSRVLHVDGKWLTAQVMRARYPEAMSVMEPVLTPPAIADSSLREAEQTLDVVLTDAGIRNGYFDIERRFADRFFPADCFGDRGAGARGQLIELRHIGQDSPYRTDMRVKSGALVSPRKRFGTYFTTQKARPGDRIRIRRVAERVFELTHLPA